MAQTDNGLTAAQATADEAKPLALQVAVPENGCQASTVGTAGFFCQYVEEVFLHDPAYGKTPMDRAKLLATGGLQIYTTLNPQDQAAANDAVNYVVPASDGYYNPGHNADTEAVVQPGTGQIEAIAEDRQYGTARGQTEINYAVNTAYGGSTGVQTGSSSKLFTLITALKQGIPFGFTMHVPGSTTITGYTDCQGGPAGVYQGIPGAYNVTNAEGPGASTDSLYTGTTNSINVFYAELEKKVGLCNVVHTAVDLGMTRADGTSLLSRDGSQDSADNIPSFTLGSVNVSPLSMAAAYATVAARGMYCAPVAIGKIVNSTGGSDGGALRELPPGDILRRRRRRQLHPAGRPDHRHGGPDRRPERPRGGGQDRHLERGQQRRHPLRGLRRLHAQPRGLRLGVQPVFPDR